MKYTLKNLCIPVDSELEIPSQICAKLKISSSDLVGWQLIKKALDTRKKNFPVFVYTIQIESDKSNLKHPDLLLFNEPKEKIIPFQKLYDPHPVIIGMGPAGLFCALAMVEHGLMPVIYEQGDCLEEREKVVHAFWKSGILDKDSNVQFGEGGAGAFSDGKLTSRSSNVDSHKIFDLLIRFGANESIKWDALPHLGTENIRKIVKNIKQYLLENGCIIHYKSKLTKIATRQDAVDYIIVNNDTIKPELLMLAIGNSARDTFRMLNSSGVLLEPKPFACGFRIIHSQDWINRQIYGSIHWADYLGAAAYRMTASKDGKGIYTFCMCPGGFVIAAASEPQTIVTNGMSFSNRDSAFGNSAIVTQIDERDYGTGLWHGMEMQEKIESKAFDLNKAAPIQKAMDYLTKTISGNVTTNSLFHSEKSALISDLFTEQMNNALMHGLRHFDNIMPGFIKQGILIAPETRTSAPIRILRDKNSLNCMNIRNLYAIGEGSGYSGGIISSAADGYRIGSFFSI